MIGGSHRCEEIDPPGPQNKVRSQCDHAAIGAKLGVDPPRNRHINPGQFRENIGNAGQFGWQHFADLNNHVDFFDPAVIFGGDINIG